MNTTFVNNIFSINNFDEALALALFRYQYQHNKVYHQWCTLLDIDVPAITSMEQIPFIPISFFKTHQVITGDLVPHKSFTSSGTTQTINSHHYIQDISIYTKSFTKAFAQFYGDVQDWCILGLLPAYLERTDSSLVYMVQELIQQSGHAAKWLLFV